ncbi:MAG: hypothetical protein AB1742_08585 [bacterium]
MILGLSGILASLLGLVLAFYAVFVNGKHTKGILHEMQKSGERQNQMLERQGQVLDRHGQILERQNQMLERQAQSLERIEETTRYVAELVRIEGQKTRDAMKTAL